MNFEKPAYRNLNLYLADETRLVSLSHNSPAKHGALPTALKFQFSGATDIGGARENQDEFFTLDLGVALVIGVLDGHGRDVGRTAAVAAKNSLMQFFRENIHILLANPYDCMVRAFAKAHEAVRDAFSQELTNSGWEVEQTEGYLLRRKQHMQPWLCVHGGTSCSVIAIVGTKMIVANVGDSSAILCASHQHLNESMIQLVGDAGFDERLLQQDMIGALYDEETKMQLQDQDPEDEVPPNGMCTHVLNWGPAGGARMGGPSPGDKSVLVITGDHSPENPSEFSRLRRFWPSDTDPRNPKLLVVYDAPTHEKTRCNAVFELDEAGTPSATGRGRYYKNVRKEWASLVATPPSARYQDALAFTRSIGDFHLHTYGVSNLPEVRYIDLAPLSVRNDDPSQSSPLPIISVLLATDGVWDNWTYEDVGTFLLDPSCTNAAIQDTQGAKRVLQSFMSRNAAFARRNFGSQADNASGILVYLSAELPMRQDDRP